MPRAHGLWVAVSCDADASPQLDNLRALTDDAGDLYYYRAVVWLKRYCTKGQLSQWWPALARAVRWPSAWEDLRDLWRRCGLVTGSLDEIWDWQKTNGWIIERAEKAARHMERKRAAGRKSGRVRRERAKAAAQAANAHASTRVSKKRLQKGR
jgi:hypothetical protein